MPNLFVQGHKLSKGKPKGAISKRSLRFGEVLHEHNVDPILELIGALNTAKKCLENTHDTQEILFINSQIITIADKMLPYCHPKLASLEVKTEKSFENATPEEKLQVLRDAMARVEEEMKATVEVKQIEGGTVG